MQEYFQFGANLIRQAGQYKKSEDYENAYIYLKAFEILISVRLPYHPQIELNSAEYNYNLEVLYYYYTFLLIYVVYNNNIY